MASNSVFTAEKTEIGEIESFSVRRTGWDTWDASLPWESLADCVQVLTQAYAMPPGSIARGTVYQVQNIYDNYRPQSILQWLDTQDRTYVLSLYYDELPTLTAVLADLADDNDEALDLDLSKLTRIKPGNRFDLQLAQAVKNEGTEFSKAIVDSASGAAPVQSVNGLKGDIVLGPADVGAAPSSVVGAVNDLETLTETGRLSEQGVADSSLEAASSAQGVVYPAGSGLGAVTYETVQEACTEAAVSGKRVWAAGQITTDQTLTVNSDADMSGLTINYSGTGICVIFGSETAVSSRRVASLPRLLNVRKTILGWSQVAGSTGVKLVNLNSCPQVTIPYVRNFEVGILCYGENAGFVHNTIMLGQMLDNKINQRLSATSSGWVNQNTFMTGRFSHSSGEGTNQVGVRHIEMMDGLTNPINTNIWIGASIEGSCPELHVVFSGSYNTILQGRFEATPCKVHWSNDSTRNTILYGYQAQNIVESFGTNAGTNILLASVSKIAMSSNLGWQFESSSSSNPVLMVTEAGVRVAGEDVGVNYSFRLSSQRCSMKRRTDTGDRIRIDGQNGVIYMGSGFGDPTMFIANDASTGLRVSAPYLRGNADNVTDLGTNAAQFKNEYLSGFLQMQEMSSDPAAPASNKARLFTRDNGSGKTQVAVLFPSGVVQVIATEP